MFDCTGTSNYDAISIGTHVRSFRMGLKIVVQSLLLSDLCLSQDDGEFCLEHVLKAILHKKGSPKARSSSRYNIQLSVVLQQNICTQVPETHYLASAVDAGHLVENFLLFAGFSWRSTTDKYIVEY